MLRILTDRRVLFALLIAGGLVGIALWPRAVVVDTAVVSRGPLVVTIDEEGRTRVRDRFVVTAPVTGRILRIELDPGDRVRRGDVIVRLRPEAPALLDARTRAVAVAAVASAEAALGRVRVDEQRAHLAVTQAQRELARMQDLMRAGAATQRDLDARADEAALANEALSAAAFAVRAASAEVDRAKAHLSAPASSTSAAVVVRAPVDGVILQRLRESESVVPAGEPLVAIGDPNQTEVVTDLLSTDAVRVRPGARATIEQWGEDAPLAAVVRRVEPGGFTKVSALGVEEQRVNVILDFVDESEESLALGDAYRVETRIVLWEAANVLKVPTSALFRQRSKWAVYVVEDGRARLTSVELGRQTGQEAQVESGIPEGATVIVHPGDLVHDAVRVKARSAG
jgi:HlyD family secretion protein